MRDMLFVKWTVKGYKIFGWQIRITLDTYSHVIKGVQRMAVSKIDEITDGW